MNVEEFVHARGGVAHRSILRQHGVPAYRVRKEIDAGRLVRVGRHRVATAGCDPGLLRAVRLGGRLTCVSAAIWRGLWTLDDERLHVSVPGTFSTAITDQATPSPLLHWGQGPAPGHMTDTIEPVINMLVRVAQCQPPELAIAIFDSAVNNAVITHAELRRLARVHGGRFRVVVDGCDGAADSGIESVFRVRLGERGIAMRVQVMIDGHHVDGLIGERLVIQADGYGPHSASAQRSKDLKEDARLVVQGYAVLRFSYAQILYDWPYVEGEIMSAMAQNLHLWEQ